MPLLDKRQHPETCVKILVKGLEAELKRWQQVASEFAGFHSSPEGRKLLKRIKQEDKQGVLRPTARPKFFGKREELRTAEAEIAPVLDAFVVQLAEWKDDRSVEALAAALHETTEGRSAKFLESSVSPKRCIEIAKALLSLGTQESLLAVTRSLDTWTTRNRLANAKYEGLKSKRGADSQDVDLAVSQRINLNLIALQLLKEVADFARNHKLPGIPSKDLDKSRWRAWAKSVREFLPESLGRVADPKD